MTNVIIGISNCAAHRIDVPDDIRVIIRDYDIEGVDESVLETDEDGDQYQEIWV